MQGTEVYIYPNSAIRHCNANDVKGNEKEMVKESDQQPDRDSIHEPLVHQFSVQASFIRWLLVATENNIIQFNFWCVLYSMVKVIPHKPYEQF